MFGCHRSAESNLRCLGGHFWRPWGDYGHILAKLEVLGFQLAVSWGVLGGPWAGLELMFEPVGVISGCLGHENVVQSAPGCHLADIVETYENTSVLRCLRAGGCQDRIRMASWTRWLLNMAVWSDV